MRKSFAARIVQTVIISPSRVFSAENIFRGNPKQNIINTEAIVSIASVNKTMLLANKTMLLVNKTSKFLFY